MNVYRIIGQGHYGAGMALVAASDEHRAKTLAGKIVDTMWNTDYKGSNDIYVVDGLSWNNSETVITSFEYGE